jgi:hypothetical protein
MSVEIITGEDLKSLILQETELLTRYLELERKLSESVYTRNWEDLNSCLEALEPISEKIAELDSRRDAELTALKEALGAGDSEGFYQVISRLPKAERNELAAQFRGMKAAVFRLQGLSRQLESYLGTVSGTMREILEELFPHRRGNIYSRKGVAAEPEGNPMVISHHL